MYRPHDEDSTIQLPAVSAKLRDDRSVRAEPPGSPPAPIALQRRAKALPRLRLNRKALIGAALAIAVLGGSYAGTRWWLDGRYIVSTDDAYVRAHNTTLASKISGYVESIPVADNARGQRRRRHRHHRSPATIGSPSRRRATKWRRSRRRWTASAGRSSLSGANIDQAEGADGLGAGRRQENRNSNIARQQSLAQATIRQPASA